MSTLYPVIPSIPPGTFFAPSHGSARPIATTAADITPTMKSAFDLACRTNQTHFNVYVPSIFSPHAINGEGQLVRIGEGGGRPGDIRLPNTCLYPERGMEAYLPNNHSGKAIVFRCFDDEDRAALAINLALALFASGATVNVTYPHDFQNTLYPDHSTNYGQSDLIAEVRISFEGDVYALLNYSRFREYPSRVGTLLAEGATRLYALGRSIVEEIAHSEPPSFFNLSTRAVRILNGLGVVSVNQLTNMFEHELLREPGMGKVTLKEIRDFLQSQGLTFASPINPPKESSIGKRLQSC